MLAGPLWNHCIGAHVKSVTPRLQGRDLAKGEVSMSAPDTNVEKQEKNHRPSLIGIKGAITFGILMLLAIIAYSLSSDEVAIEGETDAATPIVAE